MFPVKLGLQTGFRESIQSIKEGLRSIPNKGIGFGSFASDDRTDYSHNDLPRISFNYLGQFEGREGDWQVVSEASGMSMASTNSDRNLININGMVSDGNLMFSIVTKLGEESTGQLSTSFKAHLTTIINHCVEKLERKGASHTPSDFGSVAISQELLDRLEQAGRDAG